MTMDGLNSVLVCDNALGHLWSLSESSERSESEVLAASYALNSDVTPIIDEGRRATANNMTMLRRNFLELCQKNDGHLSCPSRSS